MVPSFAAALSISRSEVVPTATMRLPCSRAALSADATSSPPLPHSACSRRPHASRAVLAREYGLIVGAVALVRAAARGDVGRQRHFSALGDRLVEDRPVKREGERGRAVLVAR